MVKAAAIQQTKGDIQVYARQNFQCEDGEQRRREQKTKQKKTGFITEIF